MAGSRTTATVRTNSRPLVKSVQTAMTAGLREAAKHGRREIKAALSGPAGSEPGQPPGKVTGRLARSVGYRVKSKAGKFSVVDVGVLRPSRYDEKFPGEMHAIAVRLARGFVGIDRLGRTYAQQPRPFVAPVLAREKAEMARIIEDTAKTHTPKAKKR